ncbi:hypothetical protein JN11_00988 [Mucilaginibacter frigoritolerans]|uniref:Uncharacterized protein n=1 Tax=Mucilaginibacter frigoritolerans TaxID=652788 RepID=A0A562UDN7_9SPHI|nr:hypothetical protein [Mucilaginibacter frigoritolerans]TWJ03445.1 hypothetical protein JN11_00988 [Mucilaginibacter frigoritolerans]
MEECFELSESGDIVRIEPLEYLRYDSNLDWDKNWIKTKVFIKGGAFSGEYIADFMSVDFLRFRNEFNALYDNLSGSAYFYDLEGYLEMKIKGDGFGHFNVDVKACDAPGVNASYLTFWMTFDQTYIKQMVRGLDAIIKEFPVVGNLK